MLYGLTSTSFHRLAAAYPGNLGFEEMWQFQNVATPEQLDLMDNLLDWEKWEKAWQLLQDVTEVELVDLNKGESL